MARLYLVRHGQTLFNKMQLVQGSCDSPLTARGRAQARVAGRWFFEHGVHFDHAYSSPARRACDTLELIRQTQIDLEMAERLEAAGVAGMGASEARELVAAYETLRDGRPGSIPYTRLAGLMEHNYGTFEAQPWDALPANPFTPGEAMVPYGGESQEESEARVSAALGEVMELPGHESVLAVAHGCISAAFRRVWAEHAACDQSIQLDNCCILVFDYDREKRVFSNVETVNHDFNDLGGERA